MSWPLGQTSPSDNHTCTCVCVVSGAGVTVCLTDMSNKWFDTIGGSCHKQHFVMTNTFLSRQTCLFLWQNYVCHDKIMFVMTKYFCHDKHVFVATSFVTTSILLSWQTRACHDKINTSRQKFCHNKRTFVVTKDVFVATKIILVAPPANDSLKHTKHDPAPYKPLPHSQTHTYKIYKKPRKNSSIWSEMTIYCTY